MARFSALHTWWVREYGLSSFSAGKSTGSSIAALKVLMGVSLLANFNSHQVQTSISDLEALTGLSRPMVLAGIDTLETKGLLVVGREGHINQYTVVVPATDSRWGKMPYERLRTNLKEMTNRGTATLAALKVYLLLIANRPNGANHLSFSHERIRSETGIQTKHVKQAIDVLVNHSLLHVNVSADRAANATGTYYNIYVLLGIDP